MQNKFEIGDMLYGINSGELLGRVQEIRIRQDAIYYIFEIADFLHIESSMTRESPMVSVDFSRADVYVLCQFFGDMTLIDWDRIVEKQAKHRDVYNSIRFDDVGDVPLRIYTILERVIESSK